MRVPAMSGATLRREARLLTQTTQAHTSDLRGLRPNGWRLRACAVASALTPIAHRPVRPRAEVVPPPRNAADADFSAMCE